MVSLKDAMKERKICSTKGGGINCFIQEFNKALLMVSLKNARMEQRMALPV